MNKVKYVGRHESVNVPDLGLDVERGQVVEVEDAAVVSSLLDQPSNWELVSGNAKPATPSLFEEPEEIEVAEVIEENEDEEGDS